MTGGWWREENKSNEQNLSKIGGLVFWLESTVFI